MSEHTPRQLRAVLLTRDIRGVEMWGAEVDVAPDELILPPVAEFRGPDAEANARLFVAAVNAREGFATEALEARVVAELLTALRFVDEHGMKEYPGGPDDPFTLEDITPESLEMWRVVRAAIARAEGR